MQVCGTAAQLPASPTQSDVACEAHKTQARQNGRTKHMSLESFLPGASSKQKTQPWVPLVGAGAYKNRVLASSV